MSGDKYVPSECAAMVRAEMKKNEHTLRAHMYYKLMRKRMEVSLAD